MARSDDRTPAQAVRRAELLRELRRLWLLAPGLLAIALVFWARANPEGCEHLFSRGIYPWLSSAVAFLPGFVNFSVAQWVVVIAAALIVAMIIFYLVGTARDKGRRLRSLWHLLTSILGILSFALLLFTLLCGLNYYRLTFAKNEGFQIEESGIGELAALCTELADELNDSRAAIDGSIADHVKQRGGFEGYSVRSVREMESLAQTYTTLERPYYSKPKPVTLFSGLMSQGDITGMYFAYTVESNINVQPPLYTIPATMLHELAHQSGYMREDEANFIAFLGCEQSSDALMRYSGFSMAYSYAISALARIDEDAARLVASQLSDEVRADRIENADFWASHDGALRDFAQQANDAYLKANRQSDGVQSYGRMVDLLLAKRAEEQQGIAQE